MSESFPRAARLLNKGDFSAVFSSATPYRSAYFTILVKEGESPAARLGMVVAKKKCRLAVDRHRLKRIIRESFRLQREGLPNLDIVVLPQIKASSADRLTLNKSLSKLWAKMSQKKIPEISRNSG